MKKVVYGAITALIAAIAYGIGSSEGKDVKEKATVFGLNAWIKARGLAGKFIPKCQSDTDNTEPDPATEE